MHNFDEIINRNGTHTFKYDLRKSIFGTDDVYPMWVADTDFKAPDFILNSLRERLNHGIFGYTITDDEYYASIIGWLENLHQYRVQKEWIKYSPGVVPSVFASVLALTEPNDKIIVQSPVYFPFYSAVKETGRELVTNPLVLKNGRYRMDLEDLRNKIDSNVKMLILCSPHNPTGNVWRKKELEDLCNICLENKIIILSDEIHADIVYPDFKHIPTATLSDDIAKNTVTLYAPSKTFNIAGLCSSYMVSSNQELLKKIAFYFEGLHIGPNIFAVEATKAAYNSGLPWLKELMRYYAKNLAIVRNFLHHDMPGIKLIEPEGTFLLWLDFRDYGIERRKLLKILTEDVKIGMSDGYIFGPEGDGFQRMNIGCPSVKLEEVLRSLSRVFQDL